MTVGLIIEAPDGQQYCEVSVEDITTRKEAEKALYETNLKLEAVNVELKDRAVWMNALNDFSFDIARKLDFNSSINIIMAHLSKNFDYSLAFTIFFNWDHSVFTIDHLDCRESDLLKQIDVKYNDQYRITNQDMSILLSKKSGAYVVDIESVSSGEAGPEFFALLKRLENNGLKTFVLIPFSTGDKQVGQLFMGYCKKLCISDNENYYLTGLTDYTTMLMDNIRLYKKLKKSYEHLKKAQDSMRKQERLKAMGQIASGVTHDINNTLAPITLYTEALLDNEPELSDRARRYLKTIQNAVADIENVTQRLRTFYKQDEEQITESIVVTQLFDELIELTRPRWEAMPNRSGKVISIAKLISDPKFVIEGITSDIRESLVNCVLNAVDAMPEGGMIKLVQRESADYCILSVIDNGSGMTEVQLQRCREPFYTTKGSAGTGLGLSEVYGMIQRHSGHLEIESTPGEGTSINLYFPRKEKNNNVKVDEKPTAPIPSVKILCVDDDPIVLDGLSEMLAIDGHYVETARSGKEAIELFYEHFRNKDGFQIVITDLGMPGMDGYEVASQLKKIDPLIPIIMLSGWGQQILQDDIIPVNIDMVLSKPPRMKVLRSALKSQIFKGD
ncbi:MAG: response regulator [Spirochaetales bacterium]|nr:response regulator [Spirochaetales bacterium]